ncbi:TIGR04500 family putative peptide maturation system protein [Microbispora hainanensis]|uniref:TIGR04500 family putative peptide maturation system protein n=1 Tax=Microbispora hainanensis TaxID=568844 RepID=A0A544YNH7_9ACTN|nr:TIGR04500 family putative peptide maturation system protein [Microbispora hainanensis]TQS18256.1 TIGR04500 family putative peptide maturation system protein [Microbispora hainanensis]
MTAVPATAFAAVLAEAVALLRGLGRRRAAVPEARTLVTAWAAIHPEVRARLVVGLRPGSPLVGYDLLVDHPEGGTVALSTSALFTSLEGGVPWPAGHSAHCAAGCCVAGYLVTVDRVRLPVAEALMLLPGRPYGDRDVHDEIVEQCLLMNETLEDGEPLGDADIRAATEEFRAGHGLRDRASTLAWLAEMSLSGEQFEAFIAGIARRRRFRRRKEAELAPGHLAAHRGDFDRVRALWVTGSQPMNGDLLRGTGGLPSGLSNYREAVVTVGERWARDLPAPLRHVPTGTPVGPVAYGDGYLTGIVLERRVGRDDPETLTAAGETAFGEWLAGRRRRASIEWHWLCGPG